MGIPPWTPDVGRLAAPPRGMRQPVSKLCTDTRMDMVTDACVGMKLHCCEYGGHGPFNGACGRYGAEPIAWGECIGMRGVKT